jgi:hypothetical protein
MTEHKPYFFFSYARDDDDPYLKSFFEGLQKQVSLLGGEPIETVAFRDTHNIRTGDDWNSKISIAVQTSKVLVCIYTARFFRREFCGKEFAAFLKRHNGLRYESVQEEGQIKYRVRDARNIIPILWVGAKDLAGHPDRLPPHLVSAIHHTIQESRQMTSRVREDYQADGLRSIYSRGPKAKRDSFILHFARAIFHAEPLPTADQPPSFGELWNAFRDIPREFAPEDTDVAEPPAAAPGPVSPAPGDMLAIEVTTASGGPTGWVPYSGGPTLAEAVQEITYEYRAQISHRARLSHLVLDPGSEDFEAKAWSTVEEATRKLATPILFVDPRCLETEQHRSSLVRLLQRRWHGGVIVPIDGSDMDAVRLVQGNLRELKSPEVDGTRIVVRESIGIETFRTSVMSVAMEIFARIAEVGQVQQKPSQKEGPDARPRISNYLDSIPTEASA